MNVVKLDTISLKTTIKLVTINVLTFQIKPAIINKSPQGGRRKVRLLAQHWKCPKTER